MLKKYKFKKRKKPVSVKMCLGIIILMLLSISTSFALFSKNLTINGTVRVLGQKTGLEMILEKQVTTRRWIISGWNRLLL